MSSSLPRAGGPSARTSAPQIQATPARKRRGQLEVPEALAMRWGMTHSKNHPAIAAMREAARHRDEGGLVAAIAGDAIELHAMIDQAEAEPVGNPPLQFLEFLVGELDDLAGLDVDQMVMMRFGGGFIA